MIFTCEIPLPPSSNTMFIKASGKSKFGKVPSYDYRRWRDDARKTVQAEWIAQDKPVIGKPYAIHIRVNVNHHSDICNREKAITDLIVKTIPGVPDDCWIDRAVIERDRTIAGAHVELVTLP